MNSIHSLDIPPHEPQTIEDQGRPSRKWRCPGSSCRICLSTVFNPATLTCGHVFCEKCLDHYWQKYEKPDRIVCPLCRAAVSNVSFVAVKSTENSTHNFREMFDRQYTARKSSGECSSVHQNFNYWLKIGTLAPTIYLLLKLLMPLFVPLTVDIRNIMRHYGLKI